MEQVMVQLDTGHMALLSSYKLSTVTIPVFVTAWLQLTVHISHYDCEF